MQPNLEQITISIIGIEGLKTLFQNLGDQYIATQLSAILPAVQGLKAFAITNEAYL